MTVTALIPLPVVLPLFLTGVKLAIGARLIRLQRIITLTALVAVLGISLTLLIEADTHGPLVVHLGGFAPPFGITLVADRLSALMLTVASACALCVAVYALGQGTAEREDRTPLAVFHPSYVILLSGVSCSFLAGDLVNLYVGFEIMLVASFVLLTIGGTESRIRAGSTYVVVSVLSSLVFFTAIAMAYAAAGTVNLAQLAQALAGLSAGVRSLLEILLLTVFGIKAAVFPLSAWLPDSYPTAPAPVTAVFAGLLTKVGIYCMLRTETLLFPGNRLGWALTAVAVASLLIGILGAVAQTDLKRLLSFTLISHIGYMVFGLALSTRAGLGATIVYAAHHITVQTALFLVAGLLERRCGTTELTRLGGMARLVPLVAVLFFVPAMNLSGIPPLSGFVGKLGLLRAGAAAGGPAAYLLVTAAAATSLLTLYVMAKVWNLAFWRTPPAELPGTELEETEADPGEDTSTHAPATDTESGRPRPAGRTMAANLSGRAVITSTRLPAAMTGGAAAAVLLGLSYTLLAGPLVALADRSAGEILVRTPYLEAVLER